MKKFRKALLLAMSLVMSASLFIACGDKADKDNSQSESTSSTSSVETPAAEKYTITFVDGDTVEYEAGATISYPTLKQNGKTFDGWFIVNEATGEWTAAPATMPENDITVTAKFSLIVKTVTVTKIDGTTATYKFAVESNDDAEDPIYATSELTAVLEENKSATSAKYFEVVYDGIPKNWAIKDYAITEVEVQIDDMDVTSSMFYFDRLNKNLLQPDGTIKNNNSNYWDGATEIVTVENQKEVTAGGESEYAVKVSFDPSLLTKEQCEAADAAWAGWSQAACRKSWVAYAIPVDSLNLNLTNVSFDMKVDNMNAAVIVYGVKVAADGAEYAYEIGKNISLQPSETDANGWGKYTLNAADVQDALAASRDADYFVFSLDNTQEGYDNSKPAVAYIDNVIFTDASESHTHAYGSDYSYNAEQHWKECICGAIEEGTLANHTIEKKANIKNHWSSCTDNCGYASEEEAHTGYTYKVIMEDGEHLGVHETWTSCCEKFLGDEDCEGEWTTVGTVGVDVKDVELCVHCEGELDVFYTANVDADGKEIVIEIDLDVADLKEESKTVFSMFNYLSETILAQDVYDFGGLYSKGECLISGEELMNCFEEMPATIFKNVLGEHILELVVIGKGGVAHTITLKFNVVNNA